MNSIIGLPKALFLILFLIVVAGCKEKEQPTALQVASGRSHYKPKGAVIVVPDSVKGAWQAVKISVIKKTGTKNEEKTYTVPINRSITTNDNSMKIEIKAFLPAFVIEGSVATSLSNELKNPAVKAKITDVRSDQVIFDGWLFSRFPASHAFVNPNYDFGLLAAIPAK